jgi:hypothetical protein
MEKYGFVYIWYDKKRKMFYIGCHWGTETDGYICSSNRMRDAYRRRPQDFKRRIIKQIYSNRKELLNEEHKLLSMIKDEELGKKYYNLQKKHFGHWSTDEYKKEKVIKIIKGNKNRLGKPKSIEEIEKIKKSLTGRKRSEESKQKQSNYWIGYKQPKQQTEKISAANRGKKRKIVSCPHCNKFGGVNAMMRWHFDKCKTRI